MSSYDCENLAGQQQGGISAPSRPPGAIDRALAYETLRDAPLAGERGGPVMIAAPRASLTTVNGTGSGEPQDILPGNQHRCYFLIQNDGAVPIRVAFGTDASANRGLLLVPGAVYETPVAPTNLVSVFGAVGAQYTVVYAND